MSAILSRDKFSTFRTLLDQGRVIAVASILDYPELSSSCRVQVSLFEICGLKLVFELEQQHLLLPPNVWSVFASGGSRRFDR